MRSARCGRELLDNPLLILSYLLMPDLKNTTNNKGHAMKPQRPSPKLTALVASLSLTTLLAACGGGGGGGSTPTTSTTSSTAPTTTNTGTTATPQYAAGSQELAALNQLNAMHQQCGFQTVSENTLLDQAAGNHMGYMADQKTLTHFETVSADPHYTGYYPSDRMTHVGYAVAGGNQATEDYANSTTNIGGALGVIGLASVPYHLSSIFYPLAETGVSYQALNFGPANPAYTLLMDFGNNASGAPAAPSFANAPLTFPCSGTTGVDYESASAENPTPYVNGQPVNLVTQPIGTPITVVGNLNDTVLLNSGSLVGPSGNQTALNLTDSSNDPNKTLAPFAAFAFPTNPLQPNTTYSVTLTGTDNGTPFNRNFSFITGSQGQC